MMSDDTEILELPLGDWHRAHGARMVPFAGYAMPIQYEGIMAEHLWTRESAGLFDVSHMGQLMLTGDGVTEALEAMVPGDISELAEGRMRKIERTPTRWGRVSVTLEPVDARTWKVSFLREPVNPEKAPPLKSVELPRVLAPNFRFDTITPVTAIKNGPRVVIDGAALRWEAVLRDLRR